MKTEELLAFPEDGIERWLIRGQLREKPELLHNRGHSRAMARLGYFLVEWLDRQTPARGEVFGGNPGCRVRRDPDTVLGMDLIYISAELAAAQREDFPLIDGVPVLAAEILEPGDRIEDSSEKIDACLRAPGVADRSLSPEGDRVPAGVGAGIDYYQRGIVSRTLPSRLSRVRGRHFPVVICEGS